MDEKQSAREAILTSINQFRNRQTYLDVGFDSFLERTLPTVNKAGTEGGGSAYGGLTEQAIVEHINNPSIHGINWTTTLEFTSSDNNTVSWGTGIITFRDGTVTPEIASGNTGNMSAKTYIYYDPDGDRDALGATDDYEIAVQGQRIHLATATPQADTNKKAELITIGVPGLYIKELIVDHLTSGSITSKTITLAVSEGTGDVYLAAGKTDFDNTQAGFILGIDDSDSNRAKFFVGDSSNYMNWNGVALSVSGNFAAGSIDIGGADSTSFHVDTSGNMWLGAASFASGPFRVTSAGAMTATNGTFTGTITGSTITGGTVQTSSSGARVVMDGGNNRLSVHDASRERVRLASDRIDFYDSSGANGGFIYASNGNIGIVGGNGMGSADVDLFGDFVTLYAWTGADNEVFFRADGDLGYNVAHKDIRPNNDDNLSLGSSDNRWNSVWAPNIKSGASDLSLAPNSGFRVRFDQEADLDGHAITDCDTVKNSAGCFNFPHLDSDPGSPQEGYSYYNNAADTVRVYANGSWHNLF